MNVKRSRTVAILMLVLSLLSIFASVEGILNPNIYNDILNSGRASKVLVSGSIAQDIISIPLGLILAALSVLFIKRQGYKTFIAMLGLTGNFFYGYGLYTIQGSYTSIYLIYMTIFSLSIYSLIFGLLSFEQTSLTSYKINRPLRIAIVCFVALIIFILGPGWLIGISSNIAKHMPSETYGVFILDLCIVFPALGYTAIQLLMNKPFATTLAGVALFKILTVCLSWGFAEWLVPFHTGTRINAGMVAISTTLTMVSLVLIIFYMTKLKKEEC